jgi:hypothetical protein
MPITVSGTSITFNDSTTQTTAFTGGGGTVTSVATGNGLSGGTITTSGTLVVACPSANSVGSYAFARQNSSTGDISFGGTTSASNLAIQAIRRNEDEGGNNALTPYPPGGGSASLSGTWRCMQSTNTSATGNQFFALWCRVS